MNECISGIFPKMVHTVIKLHITSGKTAVCQRKGEGQGRDHLEGMSEISSF